MGGLKRWNGTTWAPVKRWSGTKWDPVKVWSGSAWVPSSGSWGSAQSAYTNQTGVLGTSGGNTWGARFVLATAGRIVSLRWLRPVGATITTPRTLRLWDDSATPVLIASATTLGGTATTWENAILATPYIVAAGQAIRVSIDNSDGMSITTSTPTLPITNGDVSMTTVYRNAPVTGPPITSRTTDAFIDLVFEKALVPLTASIVGSTFINQTSGSSTSITATLPAGVTTGDRLYCLMFNSNTNAGSPVSQNFTGWTAVTAKADVGTAQRALYTAVYAGGLVMPSWTLGTGSKSACLVVAVRNAAAVPVVSFADAGGLTSTAPSNASAPVGLGLRLYCRKDSLSTTCTPGGGMTELVKSLGVATGPSCHVCAYTTPQAAAGASGTAVTTWNVTSVNSTAWTISL